jgi:hypothetical protein
MANPAKEDPAPPRSRWALAVVLLVVTLPSLGAFWLGWSSGLRGEHKGDEAVRDVLVAIALLALGLVWVVLFVGSLLLNIVLRLSRLEGQRRQTTEDAKPGA